jgi:hypothetical protein
MVNATRAAVPHGALHLASILAARVSCIAVVTSALALGARPAEAITINPILTLNGDQQVTSGDGPWNLGFSFTTSSTQAFNALGVADFDSVGLIQSHDIGLYDTSGNLLVSALGVTGTADAVQDGFVWAAINPITLSAGTYIVGASGEWDVDKYGYSGAINVDAGYAFNGSQFARNILLEFPNSGGINPGYFGANVSAVVLGPVVVPGPIPVVGVAAAFGYSRRLRQKINLSSRKP